jgi:hypothetical protein
MKLCILGPTRSKCSRNSKELLAEILYEHVKERQAVLVLPEGHLLTAEARVQLRVVSDEIRDE